MWPKAIAQLIELLPHMSRLLPLADRFLNSKTADADASRTAMQQMAEGLRGDLGQVTASHAGLYRQLNEQSERLGNIAADTRSTRLATVSVEVRVTALESRFQKLFYLMSLTVLLLFAVLILLVFLVLHLGRIHP